MLTKSPSETTNGERTYVSKTFINIAFAVQTKEVSDVPALNTLSGLKLPSALKTIDEEAFIGGAFQYVIVPATVTSTRRMLSRAVEQISLSTN